MLLHQNQTILEKPPVFIDSTLWDEMDDMAEFAESNPAINRNLNTEDGIIETEKENYAKN